MARKQLLRLIPMACAVIAFSFFQGSAPGEESATRTNATSDEENQAAVDDILSQMAAAEGQEKKELRKSLLDMEDEAAPYLFAAFEDTADKQARREILDVLALSKGEEGLDVFLSIMKTCSMNSRSRCEKIQFVRRLTRSNDPANVPALVRLTRSTGGNEATRAAGALKHIHEKHSESGTLETVVSEIERTLKKDNGEESELVTMVGLLGSVGDVSTLRLLADLTRSGSAPLRAASVRALGELFPRVRDSARHRDKANVLRRLRRGLSDRSERVKANAARALCAVGERDAIPDIMELLDNKSALVRSSAREALKTLAGVDMGKMYESWESWLEMQEKKAVVGAL